MAAGQRFLGNIKSYVKNKGYGFIACPETMDEFGQDVFLHRAEVGNFDVGSEVSFVVKMNDKTQQPRAYDLQDVSLQDHERFVGIVKSFVESKGYGFISCPETMDEFGQDVFLLRSEVGNFDVGSEVSFLVKMNDKTQQPQAYDLQDVLLQDNEQYVGSVKSFSEKRGFGFLACPETEAKYGQDVYVHHQELGQCPVGSQVAFLVRLNEKNQPQAYDLQVFVPHAVASPRVPHPKKSFPSPLGDIAGLASHTSERYVGTVKSFSEKHGYGFISCPELVAEHGQDVFVHHQELGGFDVDSQVTFLMKLNQKNQPQAYDLQNVPRGKKRSRPTKDNQSNVAKKSRPSQPTQGSRPNNAKPKKELVGGHGQRYSGTVKSFVKSYGFIESSELMDMYGQDAFLQRKELGNFEVGSLVNFLVKLNAQGKPQAYDLRKRGGVYVP